MSWFGKTKITAEKQRWTIFWKHDFCVVIRSIREVLSTLQQFFLFSLFWDIIRHHKSKQRVTVRNKLTLPTMITKYKVAVCVNISDSNHKCIWTFCCCAPISRLHSSLDVFRSCCKNFPHDESECAYKFWMFDCLMK